MTVTDFSIIDKVKSYIKFPPKYSNQINAKDIAEDVIADSLMEFEEYCDTLDLEFGFELSYDSEIEAYEFKIDVESTAKYNSDVSYDKREKLISYLKNQIDIEVDNWEYDFGTSIFWITLDINAIVANFIEKLVTNIKHQLDSLNIYDILEEDRFEWDEDKKYFLDKFIEGTHMEGAF